MNIITPDCLNTLKTFLKTEQILTDPSECYVYGYDNSRFQGIPDLVVFPTEHDEVVQIIQCANQYKIPLTARGRGTGTPGGSVPTKGGIVICFERMNQLKQIDVENRFMIVEPGMINQDVQLIAKEHGFFWAPDPSSGAYCTIGGNLAYNSAGPRAIKYGTCRENTLGLKAVTGNGITISAGVHTSKGVVGYDLTRLLVGSEATLALFTEATLKLTPLPEAKATMRALYKNIHAAAAAVAHIMAQPIIPCALEFMDQHALQLLREHSDLPLPIDANALLMIEVDGATIALGDLCSSISRAANNDGLLEFKVAKNNEEVSQLWKARKALSPILRHVAPKKINEDIVVPVAEIPNLLHYLDELAIKHQIKIVNFGHAGNGNIHVNLLVNPDDPRQLKQADECLKAVFDKVLSLQGTLSGEHGVGIDKKDFISREIDMNTLELMKEIKRVFDPQGILNPGKIFPSDMESHHD